MFRAISRFTRPFVAAGLALALLATAAAPFITDHEAAARRDKAGHSVNHAGKGKGKRTRTITRTFSQPGPIDIPDSTSEPVPADPYPSSLTVSGLRKGRIVDVDLTLRGFTVDNPADVDILLVKGDQDPVGALVLSDVAGNTDVFDRTITLDDEATASLPETDTLTSGTFLPTDHDLDPGDGDAFPAPAPVVSGNTALATFDGRNPNGTWRLFVVDDSNDDAGSIDRWELTLTVKFKQKKKR